MSTPAGLPPIFAAVSVAIAPSHRVAEFPPGTFLESIAVSTDGTLFVSSHLDGKVFRMGANGVSVVHAAIAGKATGLALTPAGDLLLTAWDADGLPVVFSISPQGAATLLATMPEAIFLNGLTPLSPSTYLMADSYRGAIWHLNLADRSVGLRLEHPLLARRSEDREFPAVNGLKIHGQMLYASNTERMQLIQIPIQPNGQPGEPEIFSNPSISMTLPLIGRATSMAPPTFTTVWSRSRPIAGSPSLPRQSRGWPGARRWPLVPVRATTPVFMSSPMEACRSRCLRVWNLPELCAWTSASPGTNSCRHERS